MITNRIARRGRDRLVQLPLTAIALPLILLMSLCGSAVTSWGQVAATNQSVGEPELSDFRLWPGPILEPRSLSPGRMRQEQFIAELSAVLPEFKAVRDHRDLVTYVRASGVDDTTLERIVTEFKYIEILEIGPNELTKISVRHLRGMGYLKAIDVELSARSPINPGDLVPLAKTENVQSIQVHGPRQCPSGQNLRIDGLRRDSWNGVSAVTLHYGGALVLDRIVDEMPHLRDLSLHECDLPENSLERLCELRNLNGLDLQFSKFAAAGVAMENVSRIKALERLSLRLTKVEDQDLLGLGPSTALKELNLGSTRVGERGVLHVADQFPHLESLNLSRLQQVTDRSARAISQLKRLRKLDLDWSKITDAGVESLASLPQLEDLVLPPTITDRGLVHVGKMSRLRRLHARGAVRSDQGLAPLSGLIKLESLDLSRAKITDAGLVHLAPLTRMRALSLGNTDIDGSGLEHLLSMRALQHLNLENTRVQPAHFAQLAELTSLRELILSGSPIGSDEGVEALRHFPFVQFVRVSLEPPGRRAIHEALPFTYVYSE